MLSVYVFRTIILNHEILPTGSRRKFNLMKITAYTVYRWALNTITIDLILLKLNEFLDLGEYKKASAAKMNPTVDPAMAPVSPTTTSTEATREIHNNSKVLKLSVFTIWCDKSYSQCNNDDNNSYKH